jgi:hypothetical protein
MNGVATTPRSMRLTRRELLAAGGAAALTASCGAPLRRTVCAPDGSADPATARCELWAYDEIHRASATVYRPVGADDLAALL